MKKNRKVSRNLGSEVKAVRKALGMSQSELGDRLGLTRPAISGCELGRIALSPLVLVRLARIALDDQQKLFFLERAGFDEQMIVDAAKAFFQKQFEPPPTGVTVKVPSYGITGQELSRMGNDVYLPAEFIPNPGLTICLRVDRKSAGVVSAPRGAFIVDKSISGASRLQLLRGRVVVLSFTPGARDYETAPAGIYIGRIVVRERLWGSVDKASLRHYWDLTLLTETDPLSYLSLAIEDAELPFKIPPGIQTMARSSVADLLRTLVDRPGDRDRFGEAERLLEAKARISSASHIIGQVIGRLSGHIK